MRKFLRQPHLPLLAKELYEQALRPRTYWMRFLFGGLMLAMMALALRGIFNRNNLFPARMLGSGAELFETIFEIELFVIAMLLPAMIGPVIAGETEKKTLPLLLITDLRPWEILWQKLIARLVPAFTLLLLALPMVAVAYMLGGVDPWQLISGAIFLLSAVFLLGAICLWISAECRTAAGAVVACYLGAPPAFYLSGLLATNAGAELVGVIQQTFALWPGLEIRLLSDYGLPAHNWPSVAAGNQVNVLMVMPVWLACLFYGVLAHNALLRKFERPVDRSPETMRRLPLPARPRPLPDDEPVAWRQRYTRMGRSGSLGLAVVAAISTVLATALFLNDVDRGDRLLLGVLIGKCSLAIWTFGAMLLVLKAGGAFSMERSQDTLNVLLTTTLSGRELLRQKMVLMRRWTIALMLVLVALSLARFWIFMETSASWSKGLPIAGPALLAQIGAAVIYLPLLTWVGMGIGLCIAAHDRATSTAITVVAAWLLGGYALPMFVLESLGVSAGTPLWNLTLLSPATVLIEAELGTIGKHLWGPPWLIVTANFCVYRFLLWRLRRHLLTYADDYLGRAGERVRVRPKSPPTPAASTATVETEAT